MADWMIYGANGYTGELIAREAVARGLKPILAGRSRDKVRRWRPSSICRSASST